MKLSTNTNKKRKQNLEKIADKWFSLYIRLRFADSDGMVTCITCGKRLHYKESHCGHFRTRDKKVHRFNEKNCSVQCPYCNTFKHGEQYLHGIAIDKQWGRGMSEYLTATEQTVCKRTPFDFEQIIEAYKERAKQRANELGVTL